MRTSSKTYNSKQCLPERFAECIAALRQGRQPAEYPETYSRYISRIGEYLASDSAAADVQPEDPCFIIYTSGTTGKPKGVVISHMGITNYIAPEPENAPVYALAELSSCMLCLSSVSFIVFLREIFGTVLNGVPAVLCNEEQAIDPAAIAELIKKYGIDAMGSTPTRLLQYSEVPEFCKALRGIKVMIVGGESFPARLFGIIRRHRASLRLLYYRERERCCCRRAEKVCGFKAAALYGADLFHAA